MGPLSQPYPPLTQRCESHHIWRSVDVYERGFYSGANRNRYARSMLRDDVCPCTARALLRVDPTKVEVDLRTCHVLTAGGQSLLSRATEA